MNSLLKAALRTMGKDAGIDEWFGYQLDCFNWVDRHLASRTDEIRLCLYYKTGAGKSITALVCMRIADVEKVLVIAPPSTHDTWVEQGERLGIKVTAISHAKFRMKDFKMDRRTAVIADEFHLFGGHTGKGWMKFDRLAKGLQAPLILASATPNYNDAERVYCIEHVLTPLMVSGGYLAFLYANCNTVQNPFAQTPLVDENTPFKHHKDAAEYLSSRPNVMYLADDLVYTINDSPVQKKIPQDFSLYGYNERRDRMIASQIEERHAEVDLSLISPTGVLEADASTWMIDKVDDSVEGVLIFAEHSTVAQAASRSLTRAGIEHGYVDGKSSTKAKKYELDRFRSGDMDVLVGTASLATGTDGLDKVCDTLLILDDTSDDALRRQLIGRIMPRGKGGDATLKHVHRLVLQ